MHEVLKEPFTLYGQTYRRGERVDTSVLPYGRVRELEHQRKIRPIHDDGRPMLTESSPGARIRARAARA